MGIPVDIVASAVWRSTSVWLVGYVGYAVVATIPSFPFALPTGPLGMCWEER